MLKLIYYESEKYSYFMESLHNNFAGIDLAKIPQHIAIIMDGNGRWARDKGFADRIKGHEAGSESVKSVVRACGKLGVKVLTLYAFSVENWQRPHAEVSALMELLDEFLLQETAEICRNNVKLVVSGRIEDIPVKTRTALEETIRLSANHTGLVLNLALSYGGRTEILDAVTAIAKEIKQGTLSVDQIDETVISRHLYQPDLPDPDLLIRTSGELRVSNFLLWQIAYTEIHVTPVLWPDFREGDLMTAIMDYQKRERRFGKVSVT